MVEAVASTKQKTEDIVQRITQYLFFLYLVIFPFGQLGRVELNSQIHLHIIDLVVGLIAGFGAIELAKSKFKFPPLTFLFVAFLTLASLSLLVNFNTVNQSQFLAGSLYLIRLISYVVFYFTLWNLIKLENWSARVVGFMEVVGGAIVFFGFVQYLVMPDLGLLAGFGWDPHFYRLAGSFLDTGFAGILIIFFLLVNFSRLKHEWWSLAMIGFGLVALVLTYSRASYLAYISGLIAIYIVRRNLNWLIGGILTFLFLFAVLPKPESESTNITRTSTVTYRVNSYKKAVEVFAQNPVFGVGYNLYRYTQPNQDSHGASGADSSVLFLLATTGICGFMLFGHLGVKLVNLAHKNRKTALGSALFASLTALAIHSLFDNSIFYPWVLGWIFILLAAQGE